MLQGQVSYIIIVRKHRLAVCGTRGYFRLWAERLYRGWRHPLTHGGKRMLLKLKKPPMEEHLCAEAQNFRKHTHTHTQYKTACFTEAG